MNIFRETIKLSNKIAKFVIHNSREVELKGVGGGGQQAIVKVFEPLWIR